MKDIHLKHFEVNDPVLASIVSLTDQYTLGSRTMGSVFEVLACSIASQQLSGAVARRIIGRLVEKHGGTFPTPAQITAADPAVLRTIGFSFAKIAALKDLAAHSLDGRVPRDEELAALDDEAVIERCTAVRGIGRWTVQMLLMFHLGREDVLPVDDFGVRNGFRLAYGLRGMPKPKSLAAYGTRWQPYRSAAAWYLWRAVELHKEGRLPRRSGRAPRIDIVPQPAAKKKAKTGRKAKRLATPASGVKKKRPARNR